MDINIEEIMEEIRADIKAKGYTADMLSFDMVTDAVTAGSYNEHSVDDDLRFLNRSFEIPPYRPIQGNVIAVFIKKVIRKLTAFIIRPIVESQNMFNAANVRVLNNMRKGIETESDYTKIDERLRTVELKFENAVIEMNSLKKRVAELEEENGRLRKQ